MQTEKMFRRALRALGPARVERDVIGGRWVLSPVSPDYPPNKRTSAQSKRSAAERRRKNLTSLAGFIVVTFALGLIQQLRFLLFVNLVADVLLIAYLVAVLVYSARPAGVTPREAALRFREEMTSRPPEVAGGRL